MSGARQLVACKRCRRQYDVSDMREGERVRCACGEAVVVPEDRPREARILHCSSCGGPVAEGDRECGYCSSEIPRAERHQGPACPGCFARLTPTCGFCSSCGLEIQPQAVRATRVDATCPRCAGGLVIRDLDRLSLTECASCGGLWLDYRTFESLVEKKDSEALGAIARPGGGAVAPAAPVDATALVKYLPCLTCGRLMQRKNFAGCSGVIIDWCKGHGFWFDANELEAIVAFIASGGLDKARRLEVERQRARLAADSRRFKKNAVVMPAGFDPAMTEASPGGGWSWLGLLFRLLADVVE